jgi:hypothetical protein
LGIALPLVVLTLVAAVASFVWSVRVDCGQRRPTADRLGLARERGWRYDAHDTELQAWWAARSGVHIGYVALPRGVVTGVASRLPFVAFDTESLDGGTVTHWIVELPEAYPAITVERPGPSGVTSPDRAFAAALATPGVVDETAANDLSQRLGGTVVVLERFDAADALAAVERHRVTHAQFVPTHFVRMLKLDPAVREAADLSSLEVAVHAAAPCPPEVKEAMLDWWGPIVHEYYSGSEGAGFTAIGPEDWRAHRGSVGRSLLGAVHIVGPEGEDLPTGEAGQIWFESRARFEYHGDPVKTAEAINEKGWATIGDIGYLDDEGFLYLTDRVAHTVISGGVNIYPREIEDVLVVHPDVLDVAVIGVPDEEMGERLLAVVQPAPGAEPGDDLAAELQRHCRDHLASFKCPREVAFVAELPRLPTGKVRNSELRARYGSWSGRVQEDADRTA